MWQYNALYSALLRCFVLKYWPIALLSQQQCSLGEEGRQIESSSSCEAVQIVPVDSTQQIPVLQTRPDQTCTRKNKPCCSFILIVDGYLEGSQPTYLVLPKMIIIVCKTSPKKKQGISVGFLMVELICCIIYKIPRPALPACRNHFHKISQNYNAMQQYQL